MLSNIPNRMLGFLLKVFLSTYKIRIIESVHYSHKNRNFFLGKRLHNKGSIAGLENKDF